MGSGGRPRKPNKKAQTVTSWCFLRTSQKLRAAVRFKLQEKGNPWNHIESTLGIRRYRISSYLNGMDLPMTQYDLIRLCNYLGLKVDIDVSINYDEKEDLQALANADGF